MELKIIGSYFMTALRYESFIEVTVVYLFFFYFVPCVFQVRLITDKETNKPRGYAFIEYVHTRDMKGMPHFNLFFSLIVGFSCRLFVC